jgi:NifU-like protein involved in Fe-S cluster formation
MTVSLGVTVSRTISICPGVTRALYNRDILRLAASIPHLGRLAGAHGRSERSSPVCGSRVAVEVALDGQGRVAALGQEVKACALGQASAALMAGHAIGRSPAEIAEARDSLAGFLAGSRDDPGGWPGLDLFAEARRFPARHASILLAFEAAAAASEAASAR